MGNAGSVLESGKVTERLEMPRCKIRKRPSCETELCETRSKQKRPTRGSHAVVSFSIVGFRHTV